MKAVSNLNKSKLDNAEPTEPTYKSSSLCIIATSITYTVIIHHIGVGAGGAGGAGGPHAAQIAAIVVYTTFGPPKM